MSAISLPTPTGMVEQHSEPVDVPDFGPPKSFQARQLFAAPHVVADVSGDYTPGVSGRIDVERTLEYRRYLGSHGLGIAEAMSTTERYAVGWDEMKRLIDASAKDAASRGVPIICGIDTDQFAPDDVTDLQSVVDAYVEQLEFVETVGAQCVVRGSQHLARLASSAEDYAFVYSKLISRATSPILIHWSGAVFQPQFDRYWGSADTSEALETLLELVHESDGKVTGLKISLLDVELEKQVRSRLPDWCRIYTGDDYNYDSLLMPDPVDGQYSEGLLGILDAIAPLASHSMSLLDEGDAGGARQLLGRSVPLSKRIFEAPANRYVCGVVFLAYLNGFQDHFCMISGAEGQRSIVHYADVFREASNCGLLPDWERAASRFRPILEAAGVTQER